MKVFVRRGLLAVLAGLVLLILLGPAPAQPPGWNERRSAFRPPSFRGGTPTSSSAKTWHCPRCNREVARGDLPPTMVHCCGMMYQNGQTPFRTGPFADSLVATTPVVAATVPAAAAGVPSVFRGILWASAGFFSLLIAGGVAVLVVQNRRERGYLGLTRRGVSCHHCPFLERFPDGEHLRWTALPTCRAR